MTLPLACKRFCLVLALGLGLAPLAPAATAETISPDDLNYTARQLLQIALMDDKRIPYSGLDGEIGPKTLEAIAKWQALEDLADLEPLDSQVVCALIKLGIKRHGSGSKLPEVCS